MTQILIVDDSPQERYLLETLLSGVGYDVILANNGQEALAIAREASPDLLITDVLMPIMDGFALCRAWMNEPPLRAIPVLIYTATYTDPADEQLAGRLGVTHYLRKPLEPEPLLAIIEEVLAEHTDIAAPQPEMTESSYLKLYNTRLVEKLEEKTQELQERNNFLHEVLELNPVVIFTLPFHGEHASWISANVSDVLGWEVAEVATAEWWDGVVHPDDRDEVLSHFMTLTGDQEHLEMTYRLRHRDGRYLWIHQQLKITRTAEDNTPDEIFGSWTDVSARVEAEQERELLRNQYLQAQKMEALGTLASGIAHDFNNLLMAILNFSIFVRDELGDDHPLYEDVGEIISAGDRAAELTRRLLTFSRKQAAAPRRQNLNALVENTQRMLGRLIGEDIQLDLALASRPIPIEIDLGQFEQALINLCVNARDAMPHGGTIRISTTTRAITANDPDLPPNRQPGEYAVVRVADNGSGIPAGELERIFEPFYTTKPRDQGTGLGLATVYGITKQSGGFVSVVSALGEGATFSIYLPLLTPQGPAQDKPTTQPRLAVELKQERSVLLVEDNATVLAITQRILLRAGYHVIPATNPGEALLLCEQRNEDDIDLLLSDVVMPYISGPELLKRLRRIQPGMRALFMTGHADETTLRHGLTEQHPTLLKPCRPELLLARVEEAIGGP